MPKQLNAGAITQALQRAFGFKGRYIPMLDEVIVPVYNISDPSPAAVTRLCAGTSKVAATGTPANPFVQLLNPALSGIIVNLTAAVASASVKAAINVAFFNTDQSTQGGEFSFRDRRNRGNPIAKVQADAAQDSILGIIVAKLFVDGALSQTASWISEGNDPRQPLAVLGPGQGVIFQFSDDVAGPISGDSLIANFRWLEIPLTEVNPLGGIP